MGTNYLCGLKVNIFHFSASLTNIIQQLTFMTLVYMIIVHNKGLSKKVMLPKAICFCSIQKIWIFEKFRYLKTKTKVIVCINFLCYWNFKLSRTKFLLRIMLKLSINLWPCLCVGVLYQEIDWFIVIIGDRKEGLIFLHISIF